MSELRSAAEEVGAVLRTVRTHDATFLAASVAYYAFISLLPALLLLLVVATTLGGDAFANRLVDTTGAYLAPTGQQLIEDAVRNAAGRGGATVVGVAVLLWSTLKVFRALDNAFAKMYGTGGSESFLDQVVDSLWVALAMGVSVAVMVVVGGLVATVELGVLLDVASVLVLPVVLTVAFLPMYYFFPDRRISVREALPGAVVAAVGWTLLQAGFQIYAASAGQYDLYGVIGGILLLLTWFYVAALIVFVGVAVNVVRAGRDRQLQQAADRSVDTMSGPARSRDDETEERASPRAAPDIDDLDERVDELRADLDAFETDVSERTVDREDLEADLKRYVRARMRRGHARGWGPYLVLLYGVVMTLGAFYFLDGGWAILAMLILFLSTLGLYALFLVVGVGLNVLGVPGKAVDAVRNRRS